MLRKGKQALTSRKCPYGCCDDGLNHKQQRRLARRREKRRWIKEWLRGQ